mgnify:FL=1
MGKGIAALTFDKDYQRKRRDQINKKPATVQEGIARSGKGLVMVNLNQNKSPISHLIDCRESSMA